MDYGYMFSNRKIAVILRDVEEIDEAWRFISKELYEDTSLVNAKLRHGVYDKWLKGNHMLAIGVTYGMCEVLSTDYFVKNGYKIIGSWIEFKDNI